MGRAIEKIAMQNLQRWWSTTTSTHRTRLVALSIIVLAVLLRLPQLSGSFWMDEAAQALESARPFSQQLDIRADFQPPLLHLITYFSIRLSTAEWWLRVVGAVIPGVLSVFFTYKAAHLLAEKYLKKSTLYAQVVAGAAGVLTATSSLHIFFSQELRPYALAACWAAWSWYLLLRLLLQNTATTKLASGWWGYAALTALGLYSMYLYPFVVLGQLLVVGLYRRKYLGKQLLALTAAAITFLPWLPAFFGQLAEGQSVRVRLPGWAEVVGTPQLKALPLVIAKFLYGVVDTELGVGFVLSTLFIIGSILYLSLQVETESLKDKVLHWISPQRWLGNTENLDNTQILSMLAVAAIVPIIAAWLVSFFIPVLQPKRLLGLLPLFYLYLSVLPATLPKRLQQYAWAVVILVLSINLLGTLQYYARPELQRENWRSLHTELTEQYTHSTIAVFAFDEPFAPWRWYDDGTFPTVSTGSVVFETQQSVAARLAPAYEYQYVLVFDYLRDITDPERKIDAQLQEWGYEQTTLHQRPGIGFVRLYVRPEAVLSYTNDLSWH